MQDIINNIRQANSLEAIYSAYYKLAQQTPTFFQANQIQIQQNLPQVLTNTSQKLQQNEQNISTQKMIGPLIQVIISKLNADQRQSISQQLINLKNTESRLYKQQIADLKKTQNTQKQQNQLLRQYQIQQQRQTPVQNFLIAASDVNQQQSSIQRGITQYRNLLSVKSQNLRQIQPTEIPRSVNFLKQYALIKGATSAIGSITQQGGVSYIGISQSKLGQQTIYTPFPENKITYTTMPNISNQLQYHANTTINSWNNFVRDQYKLLNFVKKVNDPQKREAYISKQLQNLNISTFCAQALATLTYYYVFIPLQQYFKRSKYSQDIKPGPQFFMKNYQSSYQTHLNPLILTAQQGKTLAATLLNLTTLGTPTTILYTPPQLYRAICDGLRTISNTINSKQIEKVTKYVQLRLAQASAYFSQANIPQIQSKSLLANQQIMNVKKKRMIKFLSLTNNQVSNIISTVLQKKVKNDGNKYWNNKWESQQIYCHDYIFKNY